MVDNYRRFGYCCLHSQVSILSSTQKSGRCILNKILVLHHNLRSEYWRCVMLSLWSFTNNPHSPIPKLTGKAASQKGSSERVNITKRLSTVLNGDNVFTFLEYEHETYDSLLYSRRK